MDHDLKNPERRRLMGLSRRIAVSRPTSVRILGLVFASLTGPLFGQPANPLLVPAREAMPAADAGELLLAELNCVACHQADAAMMTRLASRQSPRLGENGMRLTPQFLRALLTDPQREKPGTTMPDLLHGMDTAEKAATVEALVHYLVSINKGGNP